MAEVNGIDVGARVVNTKAGPVSLDFLVIATGARNSYFGRDRWAELAPGLKKHVEDATCIRRSILSSFEEAELARDNSERKRLLTFVIGGGPTGVEMAGAVAEVARQTLPVTSGASIPGQPKSY